MQEDRLVEWASVFVFATAGIAQLIRAVRGRRPFDVLVGLFLRRLAMPTPTSRALCFFRPTSARS